MRGGSEVEASQRGGGGRRYKKKKLGAERSRKLRAKTARFQKIYFGVVEGRGW